MRCGYLDFGCRLRKVISKKLAQHVRAEKRGQRTQSVDIKAATFASVIANEHRQFLFVDKWCKPNDNVTIRVITASLLMLVAWQVGSEHFCLYPDFAESRVVWQTREESARDQLGFRQTFQKCIVPLSSPWFAAFKASSECCVFAHIGDFSKQATRRLNFIFIDH